MAQSPRGGPRLNTQPQTITVKYWAIFKPVYNTAGTLVRVTLDKAQTTRPTSMVAAGSLVVECEDEIPVELFGLKARAKLAVETQNAIKSLRNLRDELTEDVF